MRHVTSGLAIALSKLVDAVETDKLHIESVDRFNGIIHNLHKALQDGILSAEAVDRAATRLTAQKCSMILRRANLNDEAMKIDAFGG